MEKSPNPKWISNALVIATMAQYVNTRREALDLVKRDLTYYLGPQAIEAIINYPVPQPQPQPDLPQLPNIPRSLVTPFPSDLIEARERVDREYNQQNVEIEQIGKVMDYMAWVWGWAYYSPMRDYFARIIYILQCFNNKCRVALQTFEITWLSVYTVLTATQTSGPSSSSSSSSSSSPSTQWSRSPAAEAFSSRSVTEEMK